MNQSTNPRSVIRRPFLLLAASCLVATASSSLALNLFEDFAKPGQPAENGVKWKYRTELRPVSSWEEIIPGDGFAHLTVDSDKSNDTGKKWPFQSLSLSEIGPGHRITMRAKNTAIPGVATFVFTYSEADDKVDEIDIEIVADDAETLPENHPTDAKDGWTDVRLNTWVNANPKTLEPFVTQMQPIRDANDKKVSHQDGEFHTYTIEWRKSSIRFYIDDVFQQEITSMVPDSISDVIIGMRQMKWTGKLDWPGTQTMLIDWLRIEEIDDNPAPVQLKK